MKIAIVSTRGIPNNYGGFEQFAEYISVELVKRGHRVTVYNPHFHPYANEKFRDVDVVKIYSPEKNSGTAANFIYDFLSLRHAIKNKHDIVLCCGYTTAAISFSVLNFGKTKLITNVDGLEWKRSKYSPMIQKLALWFEKLAVKNSDALIADNIGIKNYLLEKYNAEATFIPYGATIIEEFDEGVLEKFNLLKFNFDLLIARMEPENNIETILNAYQTVLADKKIIVVGGLQNNYGKFIYNTYKNNANIIFANWISEKKTLDALRHFARIYIHGHSVGGTNPSLLEAMATEACIVAHNNPFNKAVTGDDAFCFSDTKELIEISNSMEAADKRNLFAKNNLEKIRGKYNWKNVTDEYEMLFGKIIHR